MKGDDDEPIESADEPDRGEGERRRLFEGVIGGALKRAVERAVESGMGRLAEGPEKIGNLMGDLKLPKEALHYLYGQIDDTKNGLYRVVAKEIRDVLEQTKFADEITKALTKLSFEIRMEVRFIPNEAAQKPSDKADKDKKDEADAVLPKPQVTTHVSVKDASRDTRPPRR